MKKLLIVVLIALLVTTSFGHIFSDGMDISLRMDDELLDPVLAFGVMTAIGVLLALLGFAVAVSLFGALLFAGVAVIVGLVVAGVAAFWPMLLMFAVIIWLVRDKRSVSHG